MDTQINNGLSPAFPAQFFDERATGMTLRDYFMAHAPAEPQGWFMPVMPPCPIVPSVASVTDDGLRRELQDVYDGACDPHTWRAAKWVEDREKLVEQQTIWQAEFRKQLCIQWPVAWADAMLEQRKC